MHPRRHCLALCHSAACSDCYSAGALFMPGSTATHLNGHEVPQQRGAAGLEGAGVGRVGEQALTRLTRTFAAARQGRVSRAGSPVPTCQGANA